MIYAYDKPSAIPLVDVYDRLMMLAEIGAAKDMYEKGLELMKEFKKDYGDLMFSNDAYQNWYNENFDIGGFINDLYNSGIDPVRSAEGRLLIGKYIANRKYGELAKMRQWDANLRQYKQSAQKLGALYNPEYEKWRLQGDPNNWGEGEIRPFEETFALPLRSLQDLTEDSYKALLPRTLSKEDVLSMNHPYDPRAKYTGNTYNDVLNVAKQAMPGLIGTSEYDYYRHLAELKLLTPDNPNPSAEEIDNLMAIDIANQHKLYVRGPVEDYKDWYLRLQLSIARNGLELKLDYYNSKMGNNGGERGTWTDRRQLDVKYNINAIESSLSKEDLKNITPYQNYKIFQAPLTGVDNITGQALFAGYTNPELIKAIGDLKRKPIMFGSGNLHVTAKRIYDYVEYETSHPLPTYGDKYFPNNFDKWLCENHISGHVVNNDLTCNYNNPYGDDMYDINGLVRIEKSLLLGYGKYLGKALLRVGAVGVDINGNIVWRPEEDKFDEDGYKTKYIPGTVKYIEIPTTRTIDGSATQNSQINTFHTYNMSKAMAAKVDGTLDASEEEFITGD